jgi:hypothetical protein
MLTWCECLVGYVEGARPAFVAIARLPIIGNLAAVKLADRASHI